MGVVKHNFRDFRYFFLKACTNISLSAGVYVLKAVGTLPKGFADTISKESYPGSVFLSYFVT